MGAEEGSDSSSEIPIVRAMDPLLSLLARKPAIAIAKY
jgi:hypothetical protein